MPIRLKILDTYRDS